MTTKATTVRERYLFWRAYDEQCFYCRKPLTFAASELDHVIPFGLDEAEFDVLLRGLGLPDDWTRESDENIVVACRQCNGRKSDRLPRDLGLLLTDAERYSRRLERLRSKLRRADSKSQVSALLSSALADGGVTRDEVVKLLDGVGKMSTVTLRRPISFADIAMSEITTEEIDVLCEKPLLNFEGDDDALRMTKKGGGARDIRSIADFRAAERDGYFPMTNADIKRSGFFISASATLHAVANASPPNETYVSDPHVGVSDIDLLPTAIVPYFGEGGAEPAVRNAQFPSIGDFVRAERAQIVEVSSYSIALKIGSMIAVLSELLRADITNSGFEEVLVAPYFRLIGGTLAVALKPVVVSRKSDNAMFEVVQFT